MATVQATPVRGEWWRGKQMLQTTTKNTLNMFRDAARGEWGYVGVGYKKAIHIKGKWGIASWYRNNRFQWRNILYLGRDYTVVSKHAPKWVRNWGARQNPKAIEIWAPLTKKVIRECVAFQRQVDKVERVKEYLKQRSTLG